MQTLVTMTIAKFCHECLRLAAHFEVLETVARQRSNEYPAALGVHHTVERLAAMLIKGSIPAPPLTLTVHTPHKRQQS